MIEHRLRQGGAADLLSAAKERRRVADAAEAELLELACAWADAHPPESIHRAASFLVPGTEHEEQIAGEGCPLVAEFCIGEFGAVLGLSSVSAKHLIGQALELRRRLPRLYRRVLNGGVPAWRARRVTEATIHAHPALSKEAAGWVDAQVAPFAAAPELRRWTGWWPRRSAGSDPRCPQWIRTTPTRSVSIRAM